MVGLEREIAIEVVAAFLTATVAAPPGLALPAPVDQTALSPISQLASGVIPRQVRELTLRPRLPARVGKCSLGFVRAVRKTGGYDRVRPRRVKKLETPCFQGFAGRTGGCAHAAAAVDSP